MNQCDLTRSRARRLAKPSPEAERNRIRRALRALTVKQNEALDRHDMPRFRELQSERIELRCELEGLEVSE